MTTWMRRLRGAIGMGVIWGAVWGGAGTLMALTLFLLTGSIQADVPYPVGFAFLGFLAGVTFSTVIGIVGRNRRFDELSIPKFAGWGAAGGVVFSVLFVSFVALFADGASFFQNLPGLAAVFGLAGAGCAGGALHLARKAEASPNELGPAILSDDRAVGPSEEGPGDRSPRALPRQ